MVRFKNRWLLVEFIPLHEATNNALNGQQIFNALKQSILANFGDTGWGAVGMSLNVTYFSPVTKICIIRVARDHHNLAWAALTLVTAVGTSRYIPNVVHLSGTIKHAQLAAVEHNRKAIARYRALAKTPAAYHDSYEEYLETSSKEIESLKG
ncbi:hypothetical protein BDN71DRAFT_1485237 [Pleurotus eryngii]|uniref:Uncharacterized protein n=1 Tax=Pleurotus eryngii TaxID=5323 RepID=A0A9P6D9L8_PLEER|nr:hypothetical protein BDN71DRAFT_1485237 [Pleurotus eryngii]